MIFAKEVYGMQKRQRKKDVKTKKQHKVKKENILLVISLILLLIFCFIFFTVDFSKSSDITLIMVISFLFGLILLIISLWLKYINVIANLIIEIIDYIKPDE